ncbi:UvrD-helicase domain-containing protein [Candidatus Poribacteria bacterium]|nr:UvrD-helicase domain-containing protein [Candidatus Poribacteria bacterium]
MNLTRDQQKALNIDKHICVTAGAGSGKTTVLVERYLEILRKGNVSPSQIVAITFTKKAAAEIKARIIKELHLDRNKNIREKCIEEMSVAPISTIHSFCARILREYPFDAKIPASFTVIDGMEQRRLLREVIKSILDKIVLKPDDPLYSELEYCLYRTRDTKYLIDLLSKMVESRSTIYFLQESVYKNPLNSDIPHVWHEIFNAPILTESELSEFINCLYTILHISKGKQVDKTRELLQQIETLSVQDEDYDLKRTYLIEIAELITTKTNTIAKDKILGRNLDTMEIEDEIKFVIAIAKKIKKAPSYDANADFETDEELLYKVTQSLLSLYEPILKNYQEIKFTQGKLDNEDLQLRTVYLLKNNNTVSEKIRNQFKYYMIDEYQDTNELQYDLVNLLTNNLSDTNLFIVGDPKQSIYGFRRADVRVFNKTREKIKELDGEVISLQENYRSLRDVVGFVNYFFERQFTGELENDYEVNYEPLNKARDANGNGSVEISLHKDENEVSESVLIAQKIQDLIVSQEKIWEYGDGNVEKSRPIEFGDITILIRARRHLPLIEVALNEYGIPYLTSGGIGFYQRQEIYDIWNYLHFLNNPISNNTSLIGVLRGPAFGISDLEIYEISHISGDSFWEKIKNYNTPTDQLRQAKVILNSHLQISQRMRMNMLIQTIVHDTGLIGVMKSGNKGEQKWANYQKLLELAGTFDGDEFRNLLDEFVEYLDILILDEPSEGDAPVEDSSSAVKIMTIHAAKGNQFPVVILPSLDRSGPSAKEPFIDDELGIGFKPFRPEKEYDKTNPEIVNAMKEKQNLKDIAEEKRVFYVAVTRAKDRLILSGSINDDGKSKETMQDIIEYLEFNPDDVIKELNVDLNEYINGELVESKYQLRIPKIQQDDVTIQTKSLLTKDTSHVDHTLSNIAFPYNQIPVNSYPSTYSIQELPNFGRCSLRYYLENVLKLAPHKKEYTSGDILTYKQQHDSLRSSELGVVISSSLSEFTNLQIHFRMSEHIISGKLDKLIQEKSGIWHGIIFINESIENLSVLTSEMELYSLLLYSHYPNEQEVKITLYSPSQSKYLQQSFTISDINKIQHQWINNISNLQKEEYLKNLEHCNYCPYADSQGNCIVNEE